MAQSKEERAARKKIYNEAHKKERAAYLKEYNAQPETIAKKKEYRQANKERINQQRQQLRAADPDKARARERAYYKKNKDHLLAMKRQWNADNPDKAKKSRRKSYQNNKHTTKLYQEKNKEKLAAYSKVWWANNKERMAPFHTKYLEANTEEIRQWTHNYYKEHKEQIADRRKKWCKNNPDKLRAQGRKRRALKAGAEGEHTVEEVIGLIDKQEGLCAYDCGTDIRKEYQVEHMTPISRGGSDSIENLCLSCKPCNCRKHDKTAEEFRDMLYKEKHDEATI